MFKRIDHIEIVPRDPEQTLEFYTRVLGFTVKQRRPGSPGSPWKEIIFLGLNDTMLEILVAEDPAPPEIKPEPVGYRMMAIEVDDMDRAMGYLKSEGIEISRPPVVLGNSRRAEIKDPNGLSIELRQW